MEMLYLTIPVSISLLWYCTIVLQDATLWGNTGSLCHFLTAWESIIILNKRFNLIHIQNKPFESLSSDCITHYLWHHCHLPGGSQWWLGLGGNGENSEVGGFWEYLKAEPKDLWMDQICEPNREIQTRHQFFQGHLNDEFITYWDEEDWKKSMFGESWEFGIGYVEFEIPSIDRIPNGDIELAIAYTCLEWKREVRSGVWKWGVVSTWITSSCEFR